MQALSHEFVVPAYRDSPFLRNCLTSVCQQGSSRVKITTSTPSSYIAGVARDFGVPLFVSHRSRSIAADWNFALDSSAADLVTLAHQDDLYYPEFAREAQELFKEAPEASLSFTNYEEIDSHGKPLPAGRVLLVKRALRALAVGRTRVVAGRRQRRMLLAFGSVIPCPSVTLNRRLIGSFRFSEEYQINLDWDAWWRLHDSGHPFVASRRTLIAHRLHSEAETSIGKHDGRRRNEDRRMFHRIWPAPVADVLACAYRISY